MSKEINEYLCLFLMFLNQSITDKEFKVKSSPNVFVFADKTRNVYETPADNYNKILNDNVTKTYKVVDNDILEDIICDLRDLANDLSIGNRIETMATKEAFVTIKDHKDNFEVNPTYRLINPAKSDLGKISKTILDDINSQIRNNIGVQQWKNSLSVIDWFKNIKNKHIGTRLFPLTYS